VAYVDELVGVLLQVCLDFGTAVARHERRFCCLGALEADLGRYGRWISFGIGGSLLLWLFGWANGRLRR